jgi:hypothetical protein
MKIGLIDVDGHNFPNLPLMKLSAHHKQRGDSVSFYEPLLSGEMDIVYMSKVFTFTPGYKEIIKAKRVERGGTGWKGNEKRRVLPEEAEHVYPDYSLYGIKDTAYGFLTRGCVRKCGFCIVRSKEGYIRKVADLAEFWRGQRNIKLLDPNLLAYEGHAGLLDQLALSGAWVDFTQGLDARLLTEKNIEALKRIKIKTVHFAMDSFEEMYETAERLRMFKRLTGFNRQKVSVYILCNYGTTLEQDLERIAVIAALGFNPFVMLYKKEELPKDDVKRRLQSWANNKYIFNAEKDFYKYRAKRRRDNVSLGQYGGGK